MIYNYIGSQIVDVACVYIQTKICLSRHFCVLDQEEKRESRKHFGDIKRQIYMKQKKKQDAVVRVKKRITDSERRC